MQVEKLFRIGNIVKLPSDLVKRKTDPRLLMVFTILSIIYIFGVYQLLTAQTEEKLWEIVKINILVDTSSIMMFLIWYLFDKGYQVGWDEEGLYMRLPGFRFLALLTRTGSGPISAHPVSAVG